MINNLFIFIIALAMVIRGATLSTKYSALLAESFRLSKYTVGFIMVAIISIMPETLISINAALSGIPSFGLGVLFGSNVADLTLIFAIIILLNGRGLKIESKVIKNHWVYPLILLLPLLFGLDSYYSRLEGFALILVGVIFYYFTLRNGNDSSALEYSKTERYKNFLMLVFSLAIMLVGSHFTVTSATSLAGQFGVNPILIGMLIVGLGTTMPELFFSLKSVKKQDDSLAVGDILGTVLADATIVVGILALICPFAFPLRIIYISGLFMLTASVILFNFMGSAKTLSKKEAVLLLLFWIVFVFSEFMINK